MKRSIFANIVKRELSRKGWSYTYLAKRLNKSVTAVSLMLSQQEGEVRTTVIHDYAKALEVPSDIFFTREIDGLSGREASPESIIAEVTQ